MLFASLFSPAPQKATTPATLNDLADEFEALVWATKEKPTYGNLLALFSATQICWQRTASESMVNRLLEIEAVNRMILFTGCAEVIMTEASSSHAFRAGEKYHIDTMVKNLGLRVELYAVLLDPALDGKQKRTELLAITARMNDQQVDKATVTSYTR